VKAPSEGAIPELEIKLVRSEDLEWVVEVFIRQVYPDDPEGAHLHFGDHAEGGGSTFLAFVQGELVGYITIRWQSEIPLFRRANIPRIHDLLIFSAFQRQGIASRLMDEAEALIATRASKAGIWAAPHFLVHLKWEFLDLIYILQYYNLSLCDPVLLLSQDALNSFGVT
jgi:GNAT superfamily N-acetyltransferase